MNRDARLFEHHSVSKQQLGHIGEEIAAEYLARNGYSIIARNWYCVRGEIDIIAEHKMDVVAVEVKTRRGTGYGSPLESITPSKVRRLRRLLGMWIRTHGATVRGLRIDAIGITLLTGRKPRIVHIEGVR